MALLTEEQVRDAGIRMASRLGKTSATLLRESRDTRLNAFDVFLSHSKADSDLILGVKAVLEGAGLTVYVDWINDPLLDRSHVTPATANTLRIRMRQSRSLIYAHSSNASLSKWMPWELGYFDGHNGNVAILPIVRTANQVSYKGEEYLGLYPYVDLTSGTLFVHRDSSHYLRWSQWQESIDKLRPL